MFSLSYLSKGRFPPDWVENLPVPRRRWFIDRLMKQLKDEQAAAPKPPKAGSAGKPSR